MWDELLKKLGVKSEELTQKEQSFDSDFEEAKNENVAEQKAQQEVKQETNQKTEQENNQKVFSQASGFNDLTNLIDYEILNGRQLFVAKYGNIEGIEKMLPIIETQAYKEFTNDLASGSLKGNYFSYLERAKETVTKMFEEAYKSFQSFNVYYQTQQKTKAKEETKRNPTLQEIYGDYIKNLKNVTTKYNYLIHMGEKPPGVPSIERGKVALNERTEFKT
jgi:hypothetical protein